MSAFWVLVRIRVFELWRRPQSAFWFYVLPLLLLGLLWLLFSHGHPFERRRVGVVGHDAALLVAEPGLVVEQQRDEREAQHRLQSRELDFVWSGETVSGGERDRLLGRAIAELVGARFVVVDVPRWAYLRFVLPGLLTQSIVLAGLFGLGYAMARYRQSRILKKLATTPLRPSTFIAALALARALLVLGQAALLVVVGNLMLDLGLDPLRVVLVLTTALLGLFVFLALGVVLATLIASEDLLGDVINALGIPVAFLSGIFFSVQALPPWVRAFAEALPSTQLTTALRGLVSHAPLASLGGPLLALTGWAIVLGAVAAWRFRWR